MNEIVILAPATTCLLNLLVEQIFQLAHSLLHPGEQLTHMCSLNIVFTFLTVIRQELVDQAP